MRSFNALFFIILLSLSVAAQTSQPRRKNFKKPISVRNLANEKDEFEKAIALADASERLAALQKFNQDFPKSNEKTRALELITSARAALADEKMRAGEKDAGIELFKTAVRDALKPISDKLYTEVALQIPNSLFFRGERLAAIEIAKLLEEKADGNAKQILALATFYLGMENAVEAKRLVNKAVALEPNLPAAYQTLGVAHRLDFQLEESANAYAKALELDPNSNVSRRSLAEMKRATGKSSEAVALYREVLAKDDKDAAAQTGLILSLLEGENKAEAESELAKSLEANPNNLFLLVGAAYWYAAHEQGARAVELAEKAVALEPRYTWARIALARGLMQQKRPLDAEKTLLAARQYGDFPTLDYELATARFQAGFYREAVEELQKKFTIKDNSISTKLGGRVARDAKNFTELLDAERRASIFQTLSADSAETSERMKALLNFSQTLETATDETLAANAADEFVKGDDKMKLHRQMFAADQLLQKRRALPKVLELTKSAIANVENGLEAPNSTSAILADELYFSRRLAIARNELIVVPDVPRQTLSNVVRGRIEDITGWALYQENKPAESVIRLKRAISVLPEKSSWWRNSMWRLGTAQESAGNSKEALESLMKSYTDGTADPIKYGIIETVYQKVNGNLDGLELKIGAKPALSASTIPVISENKTVAETPKLKPTPEPKVEPIANTTIETPKTIEEVKPTPTIIEEPKTTPTEEPKPSPQPVLETPSVVAPSKIEPPPTTETKTESPTPETKSEVSPVVETNPKPATETKSEAPTPETKPEPTPEEKSSEIKQNEPVNNVPSSTKSLFEPIVINVPKVEPLKTTVPETKPEEKSTENANKTDAAIQEKPSTERVIITEGISSRPRKAVEKPSETIAPCKATVSQESISIIKNGGGLSLLINFEGERQNKEIKTSVSDPAAIEVSIEPGLDSQTDGAIFVVKSISPKTGLFTVTFESECGKKEVTVKVR